MGIHYAKGALVQAGTIDAARPQALVYERTPQGKLELAAVEYVALQAGWDASHDGPPTRVRSAVHADTGRNRYGLPAFYSLHAWIWKNNPKGMFSMSIRRRAARRPTIRGTTRCRGLCSTGRSRRRRDGTVGRAGGDDAVAANARLTRAKASIALAGPPVPASAR